jgi:hypothetical protein
MNERNLKQVQFQLNQALVDIFSRYVIYNGQLEKFSSECAADLAEIFEDFIENDLLKRSGDS